MIVTERNHDCLYFPYKAKMTYYGINHREISNSMCLYFAEI